jgi:hypothetical protein
MIRARFATLSLLATLACAGTTAPPLDGPFVAVTVTGTVRTTDGAPVNGASLAVIARSPVTCAGSFAESRATADASGAFKSTVSTWNVPRDVCVWIAVSPPDASGLVADTLTIQPARLEVVAPIVTLDVVLAAQPAS